MWLYKRSNDADLEHGRHSPITVIRATEENGIFCGSVSLNSRWRLSDAQPQKSQAEGGAAVSGL